MSDTYPERDCLDGSSSAQLRAERDRLAADVEALCAFVDVVDDYEAEFDGVQPIRDERAAIEPIMAARRERG